MERTATEWFLDERFWIALRPVFFSEASFARAGENVGRLLARAGVDSGTVLDVGCGPGRWAIPLAQRGFSVTGVDSSTVLLDDARQRAASAGIRVEWVQDDMRRFTRPGAFDLAINLFTSFGYFDSQEENQQVLRNVHASLEPGGVFVQDMMGKELLARGFRPADASEVPDDVGSVIERRRVTDDWSRVETEWLLIKDGQAHAYPTRLWLYSGQELKQMLLAAGFSRVQLYGNMDGEAYEPTATRLIAVAHKKV